MYEITKNPSPKTENLCLNTMISFDRAKMAQKWIFRENFLADNQKDHSDLSISEIPIIF
jgi:hypothetical protein